MLYILDNEEYIDCCGRFLNVIKFGCKKESTLFCNKEF